MAECEDYVSPVEQQMRKQGRGGTAQQQQPQQQEDGEEVVVGVRLGELQRLRAAVAHDKEATALLMELMRRTPLSATQMQTQTQRTRADTVEERVSFAAAVVGAKQSAAATAVGVQHQQQRSAATSAASLAAGTTVTSEPRSRGLSLDEIGSGSETEEEQVLSLHLQQTHDEGRKASGKPPSTSAAPVRPTSVVTSVPAARELAARLGLREKFLALFSNRTDQQQQQVPVYRLELAILDVNATPAQRRAVGELKMRLGHTSPHETITAADVAELYPCTFQPVNTGNNDSSSGNSSGAESVALHGQESRRSALKLYAFYVIRDWSRKRASSSSSGNGKETGRHRHNNKEGNNGKFRWQPMPTDALMNSMDTLMGGDLRRFIQDGITLRAELFRAGGFYVSSSRDMVGVWVGPHGNAGANINTLLNSTPGFFILSSSHGKVVHSAPSAAATAGAGAAATSAASASVPALGSGAYLATPLSTTSSMSVSEFAIAQPLNSVDGQEDGADADAESVLSAGSSTKSGSGSRRRGRRGRGSRERRSTSRNSNYSNSAKPGADGMPAVMPTAAGTETGAGAVTQQQPVTPVASHTTTTAANGMGLTATPPTHSFPGLDTTLDMGSSEDGSEDGYGVMPGFAGLRRGSMASVSSISSARTPGAASPTLPHHHAQQPMHPRLAGPPGFAGQPPAPRGLPPHVQQQQQQQQQQRRQFVQPNNLRGVAPPAPSLQASDADVQQQQQQQQQQQRQPQQQQQQQQRVYHEVPVTAMQFPAPLALPFAPTLSGSVVDGTANTMTLAASNRQQEQLQQQQALNFASVPSQHQDENTASANAWQPHAAKPW